MAKESVFIKAFKFWIPPEARTDDFMLYIADAFGQTRFVFNKVHEYIDTVLSNGNKLPSVFDLNNYVNKVLKDKYKWLRGSVDKFYFTHVVKEIHAAYKAYLKGTKGKPKFRCKYSPKQTVTTSVTNNNIKVDREKGTVELPYLNLRHNRIIGAVVHRDIEGTIVGAKITREATGHYFVIILCEVPITPMPVLTKTVGIDMGVKTWITCSDGKRFQSQKAFARSQRKVRRLNKSLARKRKIAKKNCAEGEKPVLSKNYLKEKEKLARAYAHVKNQRNDYAHKASKELIDNNQAIFSEA